MVQHSAVPMQPVRLSAYKMLSGGYTPQSNLRRPTNVERRILFPHRGDRYKGESLALVILVCFDVAAAWRC